MSTTFEVVTTSVAKAAAKRFKENEWGARHAQAFQAPKGPEKALVGMILAAAEYADQHAKRYDSKIGDDGVLGVEWLNILKALRGLLNGELGRLDGGTLDALLYDMAEAAGFKRDELDA